jgi:KUP system potassium uptake protein
MPANIKSDDPNAVVSDGDESDDSDPVQDRYYYLARDKNASDSIHGEPEDRRELVRIPTCAIFHKFASGKGVPHSFVGFIRQWPALPQVVVSLRFAELMTSELLTYPLPKDLLVGLRPSGCQNPSRTAL